MKTLFAAAIAAATIATPASAAVLVLQTQTENISWCSGCSGDYRGFATFNLGQASIIQTASFDTNYVPYGGTVSIWTADQSTMLFEQAFGASDPGSVSVALGNWSLAAGDYLFSAYSSTLMAWLGDNSGNDYHAGGSGNKNFGFQLDGVAAEVPEPAMLGLFGLGAIGLGVSRRRHA